MAGWFMRKDRELIKLARDNSNSKHIAKSWIPRYYGFSRSPHSRCHQFVTR
jgi:hypothetical protein